MLSDYIFTPITFGLQHSLQLKTCFKQWENFPMPYTCSPHLVPWLLVVQYSKQKSELKTVNPEYSYLVAE